MAFVKGLEGERITKESLPSPHGRWVPRKKATLILAIRAGAITLEEVLHMYDISMEEFRGWQENFDRFGLGGLKVTRIFRG